MIVTISEQWWDRAVAGGKARQAEAYKRRLRDHGGPMTYAKGEQKHVEGCLCETAKCKVLGRPWSETLGVIGGPDVVGSLVQVRGRVITPGRDFFHLVLRDTDLEKNLPPHTPFALVWLDYKRRCFHMKGWLTLAEMAERRHTAEKQGRYWFIPEPYRTVETLIEDYADHDELARQRSIPR